MKRKYFAMLFGLCYACSASAQTLENFRLAELLDSIKVEMEKAHIPGLMLTIVSADSVLYDDGLGLAQLKENRKVDRTQLFRLGSISKSFASLCILKLESEGKLSLEEKLKDIAPEIPFDNKWEEKHPVRIIHLLEHSAGFDDMHFKAMINRTDKELPLPDMIKQHGNSLKTRWQPGTRMAYSNPGYVILTYLIEKYSGMSYHAYVQQTIFDPIGMQHSDFESFPKDKNRYAQGYRWQGDEYTAVPFYAVHAGMAGALNSCGADMAKFLQFMINRGRVDTNQVFPAEAFRKMETPSSTIAARNGLWTSYALANYPSHFDKKIFFRGHNGGIDGFSSTYCYNRGRSGIGFAISNNGEGSMRKIEELIIRYATEGISLVKPAKKPITEGLIDTFSGYYAMKSPRNELLYFTEKISQGVKLYFSGDTLFVKGFSGSPEAYLHTGDHLFRKLKGNAPQLLLTYDEGRQPVFVANAYFEKSTALNVIGIRYWFFIAVGITQLMSLFGLVWLILSWFKKVSRGGVHAVFSMWLAAIALLVAFIVLVFLVQDLPAMGTLNGRTMALFVGTLVFGIGSLIGLVLTLRDFRRIRSKIFLSYLLLTAVSMVSLAIFFYQHGWIGLQLWRY